MATPQRPLSPHLQIYQPQITSAMSILHRITGVINALGALLIACWLLALAGEGAAYAQFAALVGSPLGKFALLVISAALIYHLLNGLRHLLWDVGIGFDIPQVYRSGYVVLGLTLALTGLLWFALPLAGAGA